MHKGERRSNREGNALEGKGSVMGSVAKKKTTALPAECQGSKDAFQRVGSA